jgi:hypothetical protein
MSVHEPLTVLPFMLYPEVKAEKYKARVNLPLMEGDDIRKQTWIRAKTGSSSTGDSMGIGGLVSQSSIASEIRDLPSF